MKPLGIDGMVTRLSESYLWLHSERPLRTLSSAVVGGGVNFVRDVLSLRVPLSYDNRQPELDLQSKARELDIAMPFVGLLTAVDLNTAVVERESLGGPQLAIVASVGIGNAVAAGGGLIVPTAAGTINIAVVIEGDLSPGAAVNLVVTATEAKTLALVDAGVKAPSGDQASGTSSDAIVVAWTGDGPRYPYGGPATQLGDATGRLVRRALARRLGG